MSNQINQSTTPTSSGFLKKYDTVIGLEIHCQLKTNSKLFCGCSTSFGCEPNENTCPVCLGHPGTLPVLNRKVVDYGIAMALAIGAKINNRSVFARKQYFYPDLPKGYQISQYDIPYCEGGSITLDSGYSVPVTRIHFEEDAGKNIHGDEESYVDLNRAGIPLLEMVSDPAIHSASDASDYLKKVRNIARYLDISDGNLEEGSFRCDANISLKLKGSTQLGTKVEVKNLNSFKNVERAINYEIMRQADCLDNAEPIVQQTRLFDVAAGKTKAMRSKEDSHDYRYFPDPDLGPLEISENRIERISQSLPELPEKLRRRLIDQYGVSPEDAVILTEEKELSLFYREVAGFVEENVSGKVVANWVLTEFLRVANNKEWSLKEPGVSSRDFAELLNLIAKDTISGKIAKTVFEEMVVTGLSAGKIVEQKGLVQVTDTKEIEHTISEVLDNNPEQVCSYLGGKEKIFGFFVGQVMKQSQGKFNPALVNQILKKLLLARKDS